MDPYTPKKPFSAAPFVYMFLQLLLFGVCAMKCDKIIDFESSLSIFLMADVAITLILYFFLHFRDPGYVPMEEIQLTESSSRVPDKTGKPNNMISLYSTFRKGGLEEKQMNEINLNSQKTPKITEQDIIRKDQRKNKYQMNKQKFDNQNNLNDDLKDLDPVFKQKNFSTSVSQQNLGSVKNLNFKPYQNNEDNQNSGSNNNNELQYSFSNNNNNNCNPNNNSVNLNEKDNDLNVIKQFQLQNVNYNNDDQNTFNNNIVVKGMEIITEENSNQASSQKKSNIKGLKQQQQQQLNQASVSQFQLENENDIKINQNQKKKLKINNNYEEYQDEDDDDQDNQQYQEQNEDDFNNNNIEEEEEQQDEDNEQDGLPECENTVMETESQYQNPIGFSNIIDDSGSNDLQDFEINYDGEDGGDNNKNQKREQKFLSPVSQKQNNSSSQKKKQNLDENTSDDKKNSATQSNNKSDQKTISGNSSTQKQNTDQFRTTTMGNNATTSITTSSHTKGNQECITFSNNQNTDMVDKTEKNQNSNVIIHIPEESSKNQDKNQINLDFNNILTEQIKTFNSDEVQNTSPNKNTNSSQKKGVQQIYQSSSQNSQPQQYPESNINTCSSSKKVNKAKFFTQQPSSQVQSQGGLGKEQLDQITKALNKQQQQEEQQNQIQEETYIEKRYCTVCNIEQPIRSKHCKDCNRCVATFDHHCPWVGTCVGERNRCSFYWYLIFQFIQIIAPFVLTIQCLIQYDGDNFMLDNFMVVFVLLIIVFFAFMVGILIIYHTFLMVSNLTTWENVSWYKISYLKELPEENGSPFSEGFWTNIRKYCQLRLGSRVGLEKWTYRNTSKV